MAFLAKTFAKVSTWLIRTFQCLFAIVLIGVCSYMLHQFSQFGFRPPQEVLVPLLFSCIALLTCTTSLLTLCLLPSSLQFLAAILDFLLLSGYIASAVLLADNFHAHQRNNPLRNWLIYARLSHKESARELRSGALVRLLDAGVVLMIASFFLTTLLSAWVAVLAREEKVYERAAVEEEGGVRKR